MKDTEELILETSKGDQKSESSIIAQDETVLPVENEKLITEEEKGIIEKELIFGTISNTSLNNSQRGNLDEVSDILQRQPDATIEIIGHTCAIGSPWDNHLLGLLRAKSAADYLISKGIAEDRITVLSKAEVEPIAPYTYENDRRKNRRITKFLKYE
ncbi:Peptidoglycan-associated lipoprotein [Arenibacter antarcticus]